MLNVNGAAAPRQGELAQGLSIAPIVESIPRNGTSSAPESTTRSGTARRAVPLPKKDRKHVRIDLEVYERFFPHLSNAAMRVYVALARRTDANSWCYYSQKRMAQDTGLKLRAVQNGIQELKEKGLISVWYNNHQPGSRHSSEYILLTPPSEQEMHQAPARTCGTHPHNGAVPTRTDVRLEPDPGNQIQKNYFLSLVGKATNGEKPHAEPARLRQCPASPFGYCDWEHKGEQVVCTYCHEPEAKEGGA